MSAPVRESRFLEVPVYPSSSSTPHTYDIDLFKNAVILHNRTRLFTNNFSKTTFVVSSTKRGIFVPFCFMFFTGYQESICLYSWYRTGILKTSLQQYYLLNSKKQLFFFQNRSEWILEFHVFNRLGVFVNIKNFLCTVI